MNFIFSFFYWFVVIPVILVVMFPVSMIIWMFTVLFDKKLRAVQFIANIWGSLFIWLNPFVTVKVQGKEKIDPDKTYIITANHSSFGDIPAIHILFIHFKWIAKSTLMRVPFIGWNMVLNKTIFIRRTDPKSQFKMMRSCETNLDIGNSIMIFPEGTRYPGRELGRFLDGAFLLAKKKKVDVLPIAILYSDQSEQGFIFRKKLTINIEVMDSIAYDAFPKIRDLRDNVKKTIEDKIAEM